MQSFHRGYGRWHCGLCSYGLCSYGLCRCGLCNSFHDGMADGIVACVVMAHVVMAYDNSFLEGMADEVVAYVVMAY